MRKSLKPVNEPFMSPKKPAKTDFAKAFKELEEIVEWFEDAEVDLEEGLARFERGLELASRCRTRLKEVENKVTKIKAKFSDFDADAEDGEEEDDEEGDAPQASLL